jgi:hypothetical protein
MPPQKAFIQKGDDPSFGQYVDFYKFLQVGRIIRVDNERNVVDIQFGSNPVLSVNVPITNPLFTGRAFIGGMPEEGSVVICGFIKLTNTSGIPIILAYLDSEYYKALNYIYNNGKTTSDITQLNSIHDKIGWNVRRLKKRKQYPGDVGLESTHGSEVFLDSSITISDSKLNEIILSSTDRTIYHNSINNHIYTNAARILNGIIIRQFAPAIEPVIMDNGQPLYVVTDGPSIDENGQAFTELRTEIREKANAVLDVIESYDYRDFADDTSKGRLLVTQLLGTLVGNERSVIEKYGKILRPQIFTGEGNVAVDDVICRPNEYLNLASAYQLKFASGTKFDVDKEGHTFIHLAGSSPLHPLGQNRSLEFASDGSIKLSIGKNNINSKSIELNTSGKVMMNFGSDPSSLRSCEWVLDRALHITVSAANLDGNAKVEEYTGHTVETIHGNKTTVVDGSYFLTVKGKIQEEIHGAKVENYVNDKMTNYGGDYQEVVTKHRQSKYGEGSKTEISKGDDVLKITEGKKTEELTLGNKEVKLTAGDSKETLMLGSKTTDLTSGDIKETITSGNRQASLTSGDFKVDVTSGNITETISVGDSKESISSGKKSITIQSGNFEVTITNGNITIKSSLGKVEVNSGAQSVTINGMTKVDVISATQVNVKAPLVSLGNTPAQGGIVTGLPGIASHYDYICGTPLQGSKTVSATP